MCPLLAPYFSEWSDPLPSTGSDHILILLSFNAAQFRGPPPQANWARTDWPQVHEALKSRRSPPPLPTSRSLGVWFDTNLNKISTTFALQTPLKWVIHRFKPWWTTRLSALRKAYNSTLRASKRECHDSPLLMSDRAARSSDFKAIKKAKRDHWCEFLMMATPQTVWTA